MHVDNIRFDCTGCGDCCRLPASELFDRKSYVFVTTAEAERIAAVAGISVAEATEHDGQGRLSLKCVPAGEGMACMFLVAGKCSVYDVRPRQCRCYPFFPSIMETPKTWQAEAVKCEGIGRGALIPVDDVLSRLRAAGLRRTASPPDAPYAARQETGAGSAATRPDY